ncbi:MAG: class I SAM-dependent methyltransferase [Desulfuromonadaceae bacterium]
MINLILEPQLNEELTGRYALNIQDIIKLERNRSSCNWIPTYGFVTYLANSIGAAKVCEVGVAYGYHAEHILDTMVNVEYQGIDPYLAGYDPEDCFVPDVAAMFAAEPQKAMDRLFAVVSCKLSFYCGRANLIRKPSVVGAAQFVDGYFDLVYIDGDHTFAGVMADLQAWYGKVRKGGIICGDDFNWKGVNQAVLSFMTDRERTVMGHSGPTDTYPTKWSVVI